MKKVAIGLAVMVAIVFIGLGFLWATIDISVKKYIVVAQKIHPGTPEDALIAYMQDSTISFKDRGKIGVWTLGQIKSYKALPYLKTLYKEGKPCNHAEEICQYELQKAIIAIESDWHLLHTRFKEKSGVVSD